ncbi:MAG: asparagine synthase (glutamine-hydrolyzing) [Eubacteriales bacterium]
MPKNFLDGRQNPMCGINGYLQFKEKKKIEDLEKIALQMNAAIAHRGPDEEGVYADKTAAVSMCRLSIIGLADGQQPIFNEDKSKLIVFNGEIYNYKALKAELIDKGHVFRTHADTEVVLHLYEEYGKQAFDKLIGMFGVAIYDINEKNLILARDRAGEKPLHYYMDDERFVFSSELKGLFAGTDVPKAIDQTALSQYLQLTYIPAPKTIYQNVYKLPAASTMELDAQGNFTIESYWQMTYDNQLLIRDYETCKKQLRERLFEAVEGCMVADVPVGAFLSGGIDSSIMVGIMSRLTSNKINTFTIGYKEKQFDESNLAEKTAALNKTNHHTLFLDYEDAFQSLNTILNNLDEPFADSSAIPTYMVSKFASQHVKTVITGDGGDELFAGYQKYLIEHYAGLLKKMPDFLTQGLLKKVVHALPDKTSLTRKMRKVVDNVHKTTFEQRRNLICLGFKDDEMGALLKAGVGTQGALDLIKDYYDMFENSTDEISRAQYTDFKLVLEGDMFPKVDRMSMLNSLETRTPLVSKGVAELAAKIPSEYKIKRTDTKIILKDTFKDLVAPEVLAGKKHGFSVPIGKWLAGPLKSQLDALTSQAFIREQGLFSEDYVSAIIEEHMQGKRNRFSEIWLLFVFQNWYKRNMQL